MTKKQKNKFDNKEHMEWSVRSKKGTKEIEVLNANKCKEIGFSFHEFPEVCPSCRVCGDLADLQETLCWCYDCWTDSFLFDWGMITGEYSYGTAYALL